MKDELLTGSRLTFKAVTLVVASLLPTQNSWAQTYTSGQHVEPAFEGWRPNQVGAAPPQLSIAIRPFLR